MRDITKQELLKEAERIKNEQIQENHYDEVEIAYIPVVISKKDGYVGSISYVSDRIITHYEKDEQLIENI